MKRKVRHRRKRSTGDEPPPLSGFWLTISHVGDDGIPRPMIELDVAHLVLIQEFRRAPMTLEKLQISVSRTAR